MKKHSYDVNYREKGKKKIIYRHSVANAFSQMTFWWLNRLLLIGYRDPLELEDLGSLPYHKTTSVCIRRFNVLYNKELVSMI
jgi:hypothetical protein